MTPTHRPTRKQLLASHLESAGPESARDAPAKIAESNQDLPGSLFESRSVLIAGR